jgi:hypothetical protein
MTDEQAKPKTWAIYKQVTPGKDEFRKVQGGFETVALAERFWQQNFALRGVVVKYVEEEGE